MDMNSALMYLDYVGISRFKFWDIGSGGCSSFLRCALGDQRVQRRRRWTLPFWGPH